MIWDQGKGVYALLQPNTGNPNILTYTITQTHGLVTGSIYAFEVIATNAVGDSLASGRLLDIMAAKLPTPPQDPTLVSSTSTTINFDWFDPDNDGGSPITDFEVYWNNGDDKNQFVLL